MPWPSRKRLAVLAAVLAPPLAVSQCRIAPLLPEGGASACFAASYATPNPVFITSPRMDEKNLEPMTAARLRLDLPLGEMTAKGTPSSPARFRYYSFRLETTLADGRTLKSWASCDWDGPEVGLVIPTLNCFIDCDGGGVTVWRAMGRNGLTIDFQPHERLRMSEGCGEGQAVYIGADIRARSFALDAAPLDRCEGIE